MTLSGSLDTESSMLFRNHVVFIVRIEWLVLRRYINIFVRQVSAVEVFQEIRVMAAVKVNVRVG